ncbi:MAG: tRNA (adenosine(37)-N6)-dimethylallyltransferase MiaA [Bacteroidales bacterium]|nr:tRNA (adenosine(37)-N6)-dimethylallyltransferase MiaA [Bacteroidales bacterium]
MTVTILTGPTAVGKTELSIRLAERLRCPIISADSRQIYRGMPIGTAQPTEAELARVKHHLIACREPEEYYSAYEFERDALQLIEEISKTNDNVLVTGGSMMYIDALCGLIDDIPTISEEVRQRTWEEYEANGLEHMMTVLETLDPEYARQVDSQNAKRVIHAVEICRQAGKPYSELRTGSRKERPFDIRMIVLDRKREELFDRIGLRVEKMVEEGLTEEAKAMLPHRELNSLNTVGYKEMFAYFDGIMTLDEAKEKIKRNTRVYAKKQLTWFKKNQLYTWLDASEPTEILIEKILNTPVIQ